MKFSANPLVVAVALGLLGPIALEPESDDTDAGIRERAPDATPALSQEESQDE